MAAAECSCYGRIFPVHSSMDCSCLTLQNILYHGEYSVKILCNMEYARDLLFSCFILFYDF